MSNESASKEQLTTELATLRLRVAELEGRQAAGPGAGRGARAQARHADLVYESSPVAVLGVDREGGITYFNAAASRMTGWPAEDALGRPTGR